MPKQPCIKEVRNPARSYGLLFEYELLKKLSYIRKNNQNFTVLCTGETGSGKSSLMLYANLILEGKLDVERIAFDIETTARSFEKADELSKEGFKGAFWGIDELKTYSRSSMTGFNKDMVDLFFSVRGKNMFCFANTPSVRAMDKLLVEEKSFDAFIYIYASQSRFLWIDYKGFQRMLKKEGNYNTSTLLDVGRLYAEFDSYFSAVPADVYAEYNAKKVEGMNRLADKFVEKYSQGEVYSLSKASDYLNLSAPTIKKYLPDAIDRGVIEKEPKTASGWAFTEKMLKDLQPFYHDVVNRGAHARNDSF